MQLNIAVAFLIFLATTCSSALAASDIDRPGKGSWCYDPIRTPSKAEKQAFVTDISPAAKAAEHEWNVPAPIIAAMSIVESGYGMTRLAIKANNVLSFKWPGNSLAEGRAKFILWCQPDEDKGNVYPIFQSRADAIRFAASRLKLSSYYAKASKQYQTDLAGGMDRKNAAHAWLVRIAPLYNWKPEIYVRDVEKVALDPLGDGSLSLWSLNP